MSRRVDVVPHTHWDREWYSSFQTFRLRLVDLLDGLIPQLEADRSYAHFLLDGQMAVVDDYLAVRPEAEERIRALAHEGRVAMGPWYALPDEFLVSGETLVRNLQLGLRKADAFGGAMQVGYLPDMFGHVAQMPQILRQFGFEHAVVWRGVPAAVDRSGFRWSAPDGSTVRAEYLPQGYGNGARLPKDAKALLRRVGEFEEEQGDLLVGPILWMNGTDHLLPQPWLGQVVEEANDLDLGYELRVCSLAEHLGDAPTDGLPAWTGELRSGARANLLMGVASNRVDVKQAAARAERSIERLAEPLSALFLPEDQWPGALLDFAWLELIRNSAHDSICACSIDEVCDAVLHRYAEATDIGEGLATRALQAFGASVAVDGPVIVNPSQRARSGVVELRLPGSEVPSGCQLVSERPDERLLLTDTPVDVATVMVGELEHARRILSFVIETADGDELVRAERDPSGTLVPPGVRQQLTELREGRGREPAQVRVTNDPAVTVAALVTGVPGYGWRAWTGASADVEPVTGGAAGLSNGVIGVEIDPADGTFSITPLGVESTSNRPLRGLGALVDGGDVGDTYNWCPPQDDTIVDAPVEVSTRVLESGPVRARVEIARTYELPTHALDGTRAGSKRVEMLTTLELHAGDDLLRVRVELDNHGLRDHRLRMHLPLPRLADTSRAECAFAIVERGLEAEGGPTEMALPTFPSRRFVSAGGLTVVHEGLLEYELVDIDGGGARALALTLLRCTGMLSQGPMKTRPLPAGPLTPMEGPQMQHRVEARLALHVGTRDPYELADDAFLPLLATPGGGPGGPRPQQGSALSITGAQVSAVTRDESSVIVRLFNPSPEPTTVRIEGASGSLFDLRGRRLETFESTFELGAWQITSAGIN